MEKLLIGIIILAIAMGGFFIIDSVSGIDKPVQGVILDKRYNAPYTTIVMQPAGKTTIPMTQYHPAVYIFVIECDGGILDISVSEEEYNKTKIGAMFSGSIRLGGITGKRY